MSLAAQSVFKLHEKFMSLIEATSAHYHHILSCLEKRFLLLGAGKMAEERPVLGRTASTQQSHQSPPPLDAPHSQVGLLLTSGEGETAQKNHNTLIYLPTKLSIIF